MSKLNWRRHFVQDCPRRPVNRERPELWLYMFLLFVGINLQNKFGNKWRLQWNMYSNFNFNGTVILQLWLISLVPFRDFAISSFRYFAISCFKHACLTSLYLQSFRFIPCTEMKATASLIPALCIIQLHRTAW